jgi:hypothetical protein
MWKNLRNRAYSGMYDIGIMTPPSPAEISKLFDRLEQDASVPPADDDKPCDCQVLAGSKPVDCKPGILTSRCEAIGDISPGLTGVPHDLGSCKNLPKGGS